ncbi:MAG: hypothetical protein C3F12_04350 [Candidatus Methylomirabilota bacterium]|nr:hypothetical protein [candidate division NC10 bacterium]PWB47214.1 MAG: hypothetical protein C3F12_04350 [candidate division NC10 bacterium]
MTDLTPSHAAILESILCQCPYNVLLTLIPSRVWVGGVWRTLDPRGEGVDLLHGALLRIAKSGVVPTHPKTYIAQAIRFLVQERYGVGRPGTRDMGWPELVAGATVEEPGYTEFETRHDLNRLLPQLPAADRIAVDQFLAGQRSRLPRATVQGLSTRVSGRPRRKKRDVSSQPPANECKFAN